MSACRDYFKVPEQRFGSLVQHDASRRTPVSQMGPLLSFDVMYDVSNPEDAFLISPTYDTMVFYGKEGVIDAYFIGGLLVHIMQDAIHHCLLLLDCLLYTSPSPRDRTRSRMPSSA